jgi:hypothetical protein
MSPRRCLALAALLTIAPCLCYSQNKPACQLLTRSALEAITGYKLDDPQDQRVQDARLPFRALPRITASSACAYTIAASDSRHIDGKVDLTVWYTQKTDEETAKHIFFKELESNLYRRDEVGGLGCPAIYDNFFLYVFKGIPDGLMILRISAPRATRDAQVEVEKLNKQIALAILGTFEKLTEVIPVDQIAEPEDALKGQTAMSVVISIHGDRDTSEPTLRADIAGQLEKLGITVYPRNDPPKFPILWLNVRAVRVELGGSVDSRTGISSPQQVYSLYSLTLFFDELFPGKPGGVGKFVEARTWNNSWLGQSSPGNGVRSEVRTLVGNFATAYRKANRR